eukprot:SAG11_NODE_36497_length_261_cov_0.641975_1_plen_31_part_10
MANRGTSTRRIQSRIALGFNQLDATALRPLV